MVKKIKHDIYVDDLCNKIKPKYDYISKNIILYSKKKSRKKRVIAEIDVLAIKDDRCDVYEVKCSPRVAKAKKQLKKIKKLMPEVDNVFLFCGSSGLLTELLV